LKRPPRRWLVIGRPNVILIVWESLSAKVVERLGGISGVTPVIDSLMHEGILFDSIYATGDRSAKGLTSILSGYPAQPRTTIMQFPRKTASLPALPRDLAGQGYGTAFYYGGEPEFANIKSYLINAGFDSIIGKSEFDEKDWNSKWGAHDHVVFTRMLADLKNAHEPFFRTLFTLSSHEPFEVPVPTVIAGSDEQSLFLNAHHYTDRSLGAFLRAARAEPWWNRTLVIIVADHGHRLPTLSPDERDRRWATFHIPMLWLGGALAVRDTVIHTIGSQTDLPPTLLAQLGLETGKYRWGRNLLSPGAAPLAYFTFQDGFGLLNANGALTYDNVSRSVMFKTGKAGESDVRIGQALLQASIDDYVRR
jgi:phosphoglycerol transferase MdoB-like AlkP superfamily enzyme